MSPQGLLFALPAQSVAVRLLVAAVIGVIAARLLLRAGLRVPRVRVAAALVPAAVLMAVLAASAGAFRPPTLMVPNSTTAPVVVPLADSYAYLAPLALPAVVGLWAAVVIGRVSWRLYQTVWLSRRARRVLDVAATPPRVRQAIRRVSSRLGVDAPPVGLVEDCPGGASVIGVRHPVVVLDADLVERMDDEELEGVLAHELAHVRRRDNLVALLSSITRDVAFFVPGGRWALRQLLVERELAADHLAVQTTRKPGALASGLLKVLEGVDGERAACSALLPHGTLVQRVNTLVEDRPVPSRLRTTFELTAIGAAFMAVVVAATGLPRMVAGQDPDLALGVLLTAPQPAPAADVAATQVEPRVFGTYRNSVERATVASEPSALVIDEHPDMFRASRLAACDANPSRCAASDTAGGTLPLLPKPRVEPPADVGTSWHARPVMDTGDVLRLYWLRTRP